MKQLQLVMRTADGGERPFSFTKTRIVIGREARCDLRVAIPTVEERHCEIRFERDGLRLVDLGTAHGTFHNGNRVTEAVLAHDDTVCIGPATFRIHLGD